MARQFPVLGGFIARIEFADDFPLRAERTLGPGHYTIWGEVDRLRASVVATVPVER